MNNESVPGSSGSANVAPRKPRRATRTAAERIAKAERAAARERERRAVLGEELRALKVELRHLRRLVADTDAGRLDLLRAQLERAKAEVEAWKSGKR